MKRSFGSNSSNNSGSRNKKAKKKNSGNQKTLGVAWSAASRSSFRSSPFSDFGSYMEVKNRKLQKQYETEASTSSYGVSDSEKLIFQGVSIFVDGFTIPSHQELRSYMMRYGGRFENYFSRRSVTHIICSNLPDSKVKNLRAFSRGLPVVKPTWIVDSVSANKLLGWAPYQLDQLNDTQPKLSAFFAPRRQLAPQQDLPVTSFQQEIGYSEAEEGSSIRAEESEEARLHFDDETDGVYFENTTPERTEKTRTDDLKSSKGAVEGLDNSDIEENEVSTELQSTTQLHSIQDEQSFHSERHNDRKSIPTASGPSKRQHSTLEDPNFVENYFKNSRLHFIGTWRNRYRKRFHGCSNGLKWADSGPGTAENSKTSTIIHIDMDCFFVSVVIKNRLELQDKPVAVCHSDNPKGTAEISSANYPARAYGVKAGMFVRHAKDLCPQLVIVPYNFAAYEEVADQFYDILHRHCSRVQAISCDEAFLDVSDLKDVEPEFLASKIRKEILETTGCSASAGIGGTMLIARLATRVAKPAGQFHISAEKVDEYLDQLPVGTLHGVGSVLKEKLEKQNIHTCGQLRLISKDSLQKDFGVKTGEMLWSYSRGLDHRSVTAVQETKSIGAEVNWGVRFRDQQNIQHFLQCLCKEVSLRLQGCEMLGRTFTLKIKKRKKDAEEPAKYMGCGDCDNLSRSITVPVATDDVEVLQRIAKQLFGSFVFDVQDIRGVGLQVSKLESPDPSNKGSRTLKSWLSSPSAQIKQDDNAAKVGKGSDCTRHLSGRVPRLPESNPAESSIQTGDTNSVSESHVSSLPPMCHLDLEVLENLPSELLSELDETYGGKLLELIEKKRGKRKMSSDTPQVSLDGVGVKGLKSLSVKIHDKSTTEGKEYEEPYVQRASNERTIERTDLMPSSLSQVDVSVLQELPEELRADVLGAFPAHRKQHLSSSETFKKHDEEPIDIKDSKNEIGFSDSYLWLGNPPPWTENFKVSGNCTLEKISDMYHKVGQSSLRLSPVLQHALSEIASFLDASGNGLDKAVHDVCEVLKQYIKLKIEKDIEEIYLCFRLMRRLAARSQFFRQVYEILSPFIQASISEHYGGSLNIS